MSKKLSPGAANLLQVITRAPGHSRDELMKLAGISRRIWSNLSGELKAAGKIKAESVQVKGKPVYKWYTTTDMPASKAKNVSEPFVSKSQRQGTKTKAKRGRPRKSARATAKVREHIRRGTRTPSSAWSTKEVRLLTKLWKEGKSDEEIQAAFIADSHCGNRSISAINKKRSAEGLVFRNRSTKAKTKAAKKAAKVENVVKEDCEQQYKKIHVSGLKAPLGQDLNTLEMLRTALARLLPTEEQNLAEYAKHIDVKESFDKVSLALDTLNERLTVVEELLAGMQDTQTTVDTEKAELKGLLSKMSDFANEIQDRLND
tara:strand:- start:974 stop:1921 length:948 start_codon:yes stop_codon:yes gene_type:complete